MLYYTNRKDAKAVAKSLSQTEAGWVYVASHSREGKARLDYEVTTEPPPYCEAKYFCGMQRH